jgi:hypothetical protein
MQRLLLMLCLSLLPLASARAEKAVATFSFEDHLKRAWSNELVFFLVDAATWGRKDLALLGPDGKGVPFQWATAEQSSNGKASIAFLANVSEFAKASYSLVAGGKASANDELRAVESAEVIELENLQIGLRLHRGAKALGNRPLAGVRLPSGAWVGGGEMKDGARPTALGVSRQHFGRNLDCGSHRKRNNHILQAGNSFSDTPSDRTPHSLLLIAWLIILESFAFSESKTHTVNVLATFRLTSSVALIATGAKQRYEERK